QARRLLRTYFWLAKVSPTSTAASPGRGPPACSSSSTPAAISACSHCASALPSMIRAVMRSRSLSQFMALAFPGGSSLGACYRPAAEEQVGPCHGRGSAATAEVPPAPAVRPVATWATAIRRLVKKEVARVRQDRENRQEVSPGWVKRIAPAHGPA